MTTNTSTTKMEIRRKTRYLALFLWMLAAVFVTVTSCSFYALYKTRDVLDASGYTETWAEGVDGETLEGIVYGEKEWNKLDVFFPADLAPEKSRGAIVYIHGGAWSGGSRADMRAFARRMTKAGYVSASVGYMLYKEGVTDSFYSIFTILDEIDAALVQLKKTASERGIELDRVALGGDSAGGHILSLYAYSRGKSAPLPVAFIAPRVAPIDFHADAWSPVLSPDLVGRLVQEMNHVGPISGEQIKSPDESTEELINAVSPLAFVTLDAAVPTVAAYGRKDPLVGAKHCAKLTKRFEELDAKSLLDVAPDDEETIVFDCVEFPHSRHLLERDPDCAARFHELVLKYAERYLDVKTNNEQSSL